MLSNLPKITELMSSKWQSWNLLITIMLYPNRRICVILMEDDYLTWRVQKPLQFVQPDQTPLKFQVAREAQFSSPTDTVVTLSSFS